MSSINTVSSDKKNPSIMKKTKQFFVRRKSKQHDNLNFDNNASFICNKEESNRTLIIEHQENNENDSISLKQSKPIVMNSEISLEEKSSLCKSEVISEKDKSFNITDTSLKEKLEEWQLNQSEINEKLNCLMWEISFLRKEQAESIKKMKNEIDDIKENISNESQKAFELNENIEEIKKNSENSVDENVIKEKNINKNSLNQKSELECLNMKLNSLQSELEDLNKNLNKNVENIKINSEKFENENKIQKKEVDESILNQKIELKNLSLKVENLLSEFEVLKEKFSDEITQKKVEINNIDDNLIEFITKCVQEKLEKQYNLNELATFKDHNQKSINDLNVKINELNEKLDEFQVYQLSREVEWSQMKIKLSDSINNINKEHDQSNKNEEDAFIEEWNKERTKIKQNQEIINKAIVELQIALNDLKININDTLNEQQGKIDSISKYTELLQKNNVDEISSNEKSINNINNNDEIASVGLNNSNKLNQTIMSLSNDLKLLNMETKVMTTNISLLWDDVRSVKNFINQYDLNERLKESESNREFSEIYNQINDLKKRIDEQKV